MKPIKRFLQFINSLSIIRLIAFIFLPGLLWFWLLLFGITALGLYIDFLIDNSSIA